MTTATPKASVNGETAQYGGITTSDGATPLAVDDTVDLDRDATTGTIIAEIWEIYAYPPAFTVPNGWTDVDGVFTHYGATPDQFAMDEWGKYLIRLTLQTTTGPVTSTALALSILSSNGLEDTAPGETDQFG